MGILRAHNYGRYRVYSVNYPVVYNMYMYGLTLEVLFCRN